MNESDSHSCVGELTANRARSLYLQSKLWQVAPSFEEPEQVEDGSYAVYKLGDLFLKLMPISVDSGGAGSWVPASVAFGITSTSQTVYGDADDEDDGPPPLDPPPRSRHRRRRRRPGHTFVPSFITDHDTAVRRTRRYRRSH